jgi:hypothetical protein
MLIVRQACGSPFRLPIGGRPRSGARCPQACVSDSMGRETCSTWIVLARDRSLCLTRGGATLHPGPGLREMCGERSVAGKQLEPLGHDCQVQEARIALTNS